MTKVRIVTQAGMICLLCIFLIGCLPKPHTRQVIPEVNGVITFNQLPIKGAEIHLYKIKEKKSMQ